MEYIIIIILEIIGIGLQIVQKAKAIDDRTPDDTLSHVFGILFRENTLTFIGSALILFLNLIVHYIVETYTNVSTPGPDAAWYIVYYIPLSFAFALILGYAGQTLVYMALGKSVDYITKKVEDKMKG